jgi:acyl-CoA thioester hydrolase
VSPFCWPARVYWEDTDAGGIVYYANYLRFLERARTEWLRSLGQSQEQLAREAGFVFTVVSLEIEYRRPARLDDALIVTCEPRLNGPATLGFAQQVYREAQAAAHPGRSRAELEASELLASASVRVACVDGRSLRPQRLPEFVLNALPEAQEPA